MVADLFYRVSDTPQQALILFRDSEGGKSWSDPSQQTQKFVDIGYAVLSLAYFGVDGLSTCLNAIPLKYLTKEFRWLSSQRNVIPNRYTLLGVSYSAEAALLLGGIDDSGIAEGCLEHAPAPAGEYVLPG